MDKVKYKYACKYCGASARKDILICAACQEKLKLIRQIKEMVKSAKANGKSEVGSNGG